MCRSNLPTVPPPSPFRRLIAFHHAPHLFSLLGPVLQGKYEALALEFKEVSKSLEEHKAALQTAQSRLRDDQELKVCSDEWSLCILRRTAGFGPCE